MGANLRKSGNYKAKNNIKKKGNLYLENVGA